MSDSPRPERAIVYGVLRHPAENAVWMIHGANGWSLPHVACDETLWIRATDALNRALQVELGVPVTTLTCAGYHHDRKNAREELVCILESHDASAAGHTDGRWLDRRQIGQASLTEQRHKPILEAYLSELETGAVPDLRPPWSRPGWFSEASQWMERELAGLGYCILAPIVQVNSWCLSCILCAVTDRGNIYLKAGPDFPLFVHEAAVVAGLAELFPENIPSPLSVDQTRRWMLLEDFGLPLEKNSSPDARRRMLRQFAQIQQVAAEQVDALLEMGCIDRRLERLAGQIDGLLDDADLAVGLSDAECDQFRLAAPELKAMCRELAAIGIPETLNHGDLHLGNVAQCDGNLLFFDWTDACIAHPFLDLISVFDEKDDALREQLRDEYLALWSEYAPAERLRRAWTLAERLSALHQAVSYQSILLRLEETPKKAFGNVVPYYVRLATAPDRDLSN